MKKILVLGIGSSVGDDQLGWQATSLLAALPALQPFLSKQLEIQNHVRLGLHLLQIMQDFSWVFCIDAILTKTSPGEIQRLNMSQLLQSSHHWNTHAIGLTEIIELGQALALLPSQIVCYGITVTEMQYSLKATSLIAMMLPEFVNKIAKELLAILDFLHD